MVAATGTERGDRGALSTSTKNEDKDTAEFYHLMQSYRGDTKHSSTYGKIALRGHVWELATYCLAEL